MVDAIRRALGFHVHEWEIVGSRVVEVERAVLPGRSGRGSGDFGPPFVKVPVEIVTLKCKKCGKEKESKSGAGLP